MKIKDPHILRTELVKLRHDAKLSITKARNEIKSDDVDLTRLLGLLMSAEGDVYQIISIEGELEKEKEKEDETK